MSADYFGCLIPPPAEVEAVHAALATVETYAEGERIIDDLDSNTHFEATLVWDALKGFRERFADEHAAAEREKTRQWKAKKKAKEEALRTTRSLSRPGTVAVPTISDDEWNNGSWHLGTSSTPQILKRLDVSGLWDGEPPQEWVLEPIIRVGGGTQIQSAPGLGKSLLAQDITMTLANPDRYVLGVKPDRAYRAVYIDFENDPHRDLLPRLEALGYDSSPEHYENVYFVTMPDMAAMDTPEGGAVVLRTAKAFNADVVIVDTLGRSVDGPENDSDTFHHWYRYVGMPLKREGIAWVRLDHVGKDSSKGARGSSAKAGDVDLSWDMRACQAGDFRLVNTKSRGPISEQVLTVKRETIDGRLTHRVETKVTEHQARVDRLVDALDDAQVPANASVRTTKTAIRETLQIHAKNEVIEDAVRRRKARA